MKKILLSLLLIVVITSCKNDKQANSGAIERTTDTSSKSGETKVVKNEKHLNCDDEINREIQQHGNDWCDDNDIYTIHSITSTEYEDFKKNKWGTNPIQENKISWSKIIQLIDSDKCYEKFIQFTYDQAATNNSGINVTTSPCFYREGSCYSVPLLLAIHHKFVNATDLECTIAKDENGEFVIFKCKNSTLPYEYFDVSRFPNFIGAMKKKHNIQ